MSSKINSKDIINKQKEKYAESPWSEFLTEEFDKPQFETFINKTIENFHNKIMFQPPMKDWFSDFERTSLDDLKVVMIGELQDDCPINFTQNYYKEGVMYYSLARTKSNGTYKLEDWRMFNIYFIDYLMSKKKDLVFVFIGFNASEFANLISNDHSKIFLPEYDHSLWQEHGDYMEQKLHFSINSLLSSKDIEGINW